MACSSGEDYNSDLLGFSAPRKQHSSQSGQRIVYRDEEEAAKAGKRGRWNDAKPVPPWEWRSKTMRE